MRVFDIYLFTFCTARSIHFHCLLATDFVLYVLLSSYVYLVYYVCIAVFTLDAGLLAIS